MAQADARVRLRPPVPRRIDVSDAQRLTSWSPLGGRPACLHPSASAIDVIQDESGKPLRSGDHARRFFEAAWMHRVRDTYYLSYSTGDTHLIVYATARSPYGPFTFRALLTF